jgi:hypothetical protein
MKNFVALRLFIQKPEQESGIAHKNLMRNQPLTIYVVMIRDKPIIAISENLTYIRYFLICVS